jgi:ATP-dependent 26S proteasome regulatory subunit
MLDPALIRPGRISLKVELGYVTEDVFKQFVNLYYETDYEFNHEETIRSEVTMA